MKSLLKSNQKPHIKETPGFCFRVFFFSLFLKDCRYREVFNNFLIESLIEVEGRDSSRMSGTFEKRKRLVQPRQAKGEWAKKALFAFMTI
jgi:hypothetical protein